MKMNIEAARDANWDTCKRKNAKTAARIELMIPAPLNIPKMSKRVFIAYHMSSIGTMSMLSIPGHKSHDVGMKNTLERNFTSC